MSKTTLEQRYYEHFSLRHFPRERIVHFARGAKLDNSKVAYAMMNTAIAKHVYAVILAGGRGTRFWPLSRRTHPRQLQQLFGEGTLLENTIDRVRSLVPPSRTYVMTSKLLRDAVYSTLPHVPRSQVIAEPVGRNTTPTIGLAGHEILRRDPDGIMLVLPSDHVIRKPARFLRIIRVACQTVSRNTFSVVIGLKPTRPETGYGYLRLGAEKQCFSGVDLYRVEKFTEKPTLAKAKTYVSSGRYYWNGGMFVGRAATLIQNMERFQPRMAAGLAEITLKGGAKNTAALHKVFPRLDKVSIDYALMENISNLYAIPADVGWSDVGSWAEIYDLKPKDLDGNFKPPNALCLDSQGNLIVSPHRFVVTVGVTSLVIVNTGDALLVCSRDSLQSVGIAVERLEVIGRKDLV